MGWPVGEALDQRPKTRASLQAGLAGVGDSRQDGAQS